MLYSYKTNRRSSPDAQCVQMTTTTNVRMSKEYFKQHVHVRLRGGVNAYAIGCGVLATIEQWYPTRKFNGTMVPHKRNSKVWPGLVTKEKTMKLPRKCHVYSVGVCVCVCLRHDFHTVEHTTEGAKYEMLVLKNTL